jgi:hypothetical protein
VQGASKAPRKAHTQGAKDVPSYVKRAHSLAHSCRTVLSWQRKLTEVTATDAIFEVFFLHAVASTSANKAEPFLTDVITTNDTNLSNPFSKLPFAVLWK